MAGPAAYARRQFPGAAADTTIASSINNTDNSVTLASTSGWPDSTYTGGILVEFFSVTTGATAEKAWASGRTTTTLSLSERGVDGTSATSHSAGTGIRPVAGAIDADEANKAVNETVGQISAAGQILVGDGANSMTAVAAGTSGRILVGNGTTVASVAVSGDVTLAANGAVTIGNDKVDSQHIAAGAVDLEHMSANSVDSDQYVDESIDTAHLGDDQVTLAKIAAAAKPRWMVGFSGDASLATTATQLEEGGSGGGSVSAGIVVPEACAIVGLSVSIESARTAGSLTCEVYKNGSGTGLTVVIDDNPTQYGYATQGETADTLAAGDRIDVRASNSSFTVAGSDQFNAYVLLQAV